MDSRFPRVAESEESLHEKFLPLIWRHSVASPHKAAFVSFIILSLASADNFSNLMFVFSLLLSFFFNVYLKKLPYMPYKFSTLTSQIIFYIFYEQRVYGLMKRKTNIALFRAYICYDDISLR